MGSHRQIFIPPATQAGDKCTTVAVISEAIQYLTGYFERNMTLLWFSQWKLLRKTGMFKYLGFHSGSQGLISTNLPVWGHVKTPSTPTGRALSCCIQLQFPVGRHQSRDSLHSPLSWAGEGSQALCWMPRQFLHRDNSIPLPCPIRPARLLPVPPAAQRSPSPRLLLFSRLLASKALHSHVPPTPASWQHTSLHHPALHVGGMRSEIKYCILYFRSLGRLHFCLLQLQMAILMENK